MRRLDLDFGRALRGGVVLAISGMAIFGAQPTGSGSTDTPAPREVVETEPRPKNDEPPYPAPPFILAAPSVEEPLEPERHWFSAKLFSEARLAARGGETPKAIRLATASVAKCGRGHALLARAYASLGATEASLYWLERAAMEEGLDPQAIDKDRGLEILRRDPRWRTVRRFLGQAAAYWSKNGHADVMVLDREPAHGKTKAVVLWLHPSGAAPDDNLEQACGTRARRDGFVCVGVSGTTALGPMTYRWSADPNDNARHIASLLDEARSRGVQTGKPIVLMGLGEGAQVALETAARDPERYPGAIAMSPHGLAWHLNEIPADERPARQHYVLAFGSFEPLATVGTAYMDADLLRVLGAKVKVHTAWFYAKETLPPDLGVRLPEWLATIVDGKRLAPAEQPRR